MMEPQRGLRLSRRLAGALALVGLATGAAAQDAHPPASQLAATDRPAATGAASASGLEGLLALVPELQRSLLPTLGADAPDWLKRIEFDWCLSTESKPEYTIRTIQPLFQSPGQQDTVFVQASLARYSLAGEVRTTGNIGAGYRRLLLDKTVLLGVNAF